MLYYCFKLCYISWLHERRFFCLLSSFVSPSRVVEKQKREKGYDNAIKDCLYLRLNRVSKAA